MYTPSVILVSWRTPSSRLAWSTPLSADPSPPFRPFWMLYDTNRIGVCPPPPPPPCIRPHTPSHSLPKDIFISLPLPYVRSPACRPPPTSASPVLSCPLRPVPIGVLFPSPTPTTTPTTVPFTSSWSTPYQPCTRESISLKRLM